MTKLLERFSRAWRVARRFFPELRAERSRLIGAVLLLFGVVALELLRPWPLQWLIDHVLLAPTAVERTSRVVFGAAGVMLAAPPVPSMIRTLLAGKDARVLAPELSRVTSV